MRLSNRPDTARSTATPPPMTMTIALRFVRKAATPTLIILGSFIPRTGKAQSDDYSAPRNAVVNAAGARLIRISAGAGYLNVTGRTGITQVRVTGVARASSRRVLDEIKLQAERQGDEVVIKVITPDNDNSPWDVFRGDWHQQLDLDIDVPINTPLEVADGSGELKIRGTGPVRLTDGSGDLEVAGIKGDVRIHDGSGNVNVRGVDGDVDVDDGSGNIDADNVTGNFTIGSDGSGQVDVTGVGGTMRIESKGSGGVNVDRVGGDFIVDRKGSGSIEYSTVKGRVSVPERRRRNRG
jgi:hypothetical protein